MTDKEIDKYVNMGDIEKDEEITTERAMAEVYRWTRVVEHESYEYENLTPKVLSIVIEALKQTEDLITNIDKLPRIKVGNSNSPTVKYCIDEVLIYHLLEHYGADMSHMKVRIRNEQNRRKYRNAQEISRIIRY